MRGSEHGVADLANDPNLLLHDHVRVLRSSCRETQDRPRRTPSHCSRPPFQCFKSVRVAAKAPVTTYLGVAPNWEDFILPTRSITHHQRYGTNCCRITESAKQKQRNDASLLSPTRPSARFTRWARGSTSKTQSHDAGAAFGYATQAQQLFCFEVAVCFLCMLLAPYWATAWHMFMCTG